MIRAFIAILLFAVFFLAGMVFGFDKNMDFEETRHDLIEQKDDTDTQDLQDIKPEKASIIQDEEHFVQKTAFFLENIVRSFYELIVQIMYGFVEMFFD